MKYVLQAADGAFKRDPGDSKAAGAKVREVHMIVKEYKPNPWKPTKTENPNFLCPHCHSDNLWYKELDNDHDDVKYECRDCNKRWVSEGADA